MRTHLFRWLEDLSQYFDNPNLPNELPRGGLVALFEKIAQFSRSGLLRVYDPLTYDIAFSILLFTGIDPEEAFHYMMAHCEFSALVFQERIHDSPFDRYREEHDQYGA